MSMIGKGREPAGGGAVSWAVAIGIAAILAVAPAAWWPLDPYGLIKNAVVEVGAFVLAAACLLEAVARGRLRIRRTDVTIPLALFLALTILSWSLASSRAYAGPRLREILSLVILYLLAQNRLGSGRARYLVFGGALAGLAAAALPALAQFAGIISTRWETSPWGGALGRRVYGLMLNPNILAGHIMAVAPLGLAAFLFVWRGRARLLGGALLVAAFACLLLTVSWGGYAGTGAAIAFVGLASRGRARRALVPGPGPLILALSCIVLAILFFAARGSSVVSDTSGMRARFLIWRASIEAIRTRPLIGHGPGAIPVALGRPLTSVVMEEYAKHPGRRPWTGSYRIRLLDGDYFGEAVEFGIAGLALLAWFFAVAIRDSWRVARRARDPASLCAAVGLGGCAAAFIVQSTVSYPLRVPPTAALLFVLAGIISSDASYGWWFPRTGAVIRAVILAAVSVVLIAAALSIATLRGEILLVEAFRSASAGLWGRAAQRAVQATRFPLVDPEAFNILGDAMMQLGRPEGAERAFIALAALDPARPDTLRKLGDISDMRGRPAEALRYYRRAVELERHDTPLLRIPLARLLAEKGDREEARRIIEEGIALYPGEPTLRRELATFGVKP